MRRFFLFFAILLTTSCFSYDTYLFSPQGNFEFTSVNYGPYRLTGFKFTGATIYGIEEERYVHLGTIEKPFAWVRDYALKVGDEVMCAHYSPFFSYGTLLDSLKEYEIRDEENNVIGRIEGFFSTKVAAEFLFYNDQGDPFAKAVLNQSRSELTISTLDGQPLLTCTKILDVDYYYHYWSTSLKNTYFWTIKKELGASFDTRFLWPFMAFVSEAWCI